MRINHIIKSLDFKILLQSLTNRSGLSRNLLPGNTSSQQISQKSRLSKPYYSSTFLFAI